MRAKLTKQTQLSFKTPPNSICAALKSLLIRMNATIEFKIEIKLATKGGTVVYWEEGTSQYSTFLEQQILVGNKYIWI